MLKGQICFVTGAASGIGRAIAELFADNGAEVIASDVQIDLLNSWISARNASGGVGSVSAIEQDVTDEARWIAISKEIADKHGRLDTLVHNAGIGVGAMLQEMEGAVWRRQVAINLDSVFYGTKALLPLLKAPASASVIMMSSTAGIRGTPGLSGYAATKAGVRLFAKSIALELAHEGSRIRVNSIHPGIIGTPLWDSEDGAGHLMAGKLDAIDGKTNKVDINRVASVAVPGGIAGTPLDVAKVALFLASDLSSYVNGVEIPVDAGVSA
ncbi:SDR family NAD(P)-dependent oxidoreductase [Sphingobium chungbukense]|uniref:Ketoreductase domain-containing protein n=1 Tax=Sphingobium chungbukense TaxID=56193 RepID=A0A0M3AJU0_9SPHN|nr:SDR family oxidoreductase [Sphingobium chungbukense]KKW90130.1 hypothetical protein YP76_22090 [Sphingobium chungbukense]